MTAGFEAGAAGCGREGAVRGAEPGAERGSRQEADRRSATGRPMATRPGSPAAGVGGPGTPPLPGCIWSAESLPEAVTCLSRLARCCLAGKED